MKKHAEKTNYLIIPLIAAIISAAFLFSNTTRDLGLLKKTGAHIFTVIASLIFTYSFIRNNYLQTRWTLELKIFFAYIIYLLFNLCAQFLPADFIILYSGIETFFRFVIYFVFAFCLYNAVNRSKDLNIVFITVIWISIISAVYGYFQMAGIDFRLVNPYVWGDLKSSFGNPQFYGAFILTAVFMNAAAIVYLKNKNYKIISAAAIANLLIQLPATEARSSFLGLGIAALLTVFLIIFKIKNIRKHIIAAIIILTLILTALGFIENSFVNKAYKGLKERFSVVEYGTGRMRISSYMSAMRCIYDNYIFGAGIGSYQIIDPFYRSPLYTYDGITNNQLNTHSEDLQVWQETGTVGLILYYLLLTVLFLRALHYIFKIQSYRCALIMIFLLSGFISVWIQNFVDVALRFTSGAIFYWLNFTVMICFIERSYLLQKSLKNTSAAKFSLMKNLCAKIIFILLIILLIALCRYHYNNYITNSMLQKATSYERGDSKFYDEAGREAPHLRYKFLIEFYSEGLKRNPYDYETYYKLAHCYYSQNDFDKALELYLKLQRFAPFYSNLNYNIALCYYNKKDLNNTIYYLNREIYSNTTSANFKRLYFFYNEKFPEKDNTNIIKNTIWIEKDNPEYRSFLAFEYFNRGRLYDAIEQYELVARLSTDYVKYSGGLYNIAMNIKNTDYESRVSELRTLKIEAFKNIGVIYYTKLNNNNRAIQYFDQYLTLSENETEKNKVLLLSENLKKQLIKK